LTRIKPYYQDEHITLYCGDCAEILPTLDPVDLTVTSPPYDNLRDYEGYVFDFERIAEGLWSVTKPGGVVVWVVADATVNGSETLTSFKQALYFRELGFNVETMIYEVAGTGAKGSNYYYWQAFEYMFVFAKGQPKTSNRIADVPHSHAGQKLVGGPKGRALSSRVVRKGLVAKDMAIRPNIWRYNPNDFDRTEHPAMFPNPLAGDHIRTWANPGDTILDPMMGSGTTGKMARINGCKFIGIDISEKYCEIAVQRMSQQVLPFTIDNPHPS
jgi:DNA modification methylase